jgi:phosphate transport system permease protein
MSARMKPRSPRGRKVLNTMVNVGAVVSAVIGIVALFWITITVLIKGWAALNLNFFTRMPTPPGIEGGGLLSAMVGTLILTLLATLAAVPLGPTFSWVCLPLLWAFLPMRCW